jgi:hypothetical protein
MKGKSGAIPVAVQFPEEIKSPPEKFPFPVGNVLYSLFFLPEYFIVG